jgi:FkbM family methyltransferase
MLGKLSYRKALVRLLDRPGGRGLLGSVATRIMLDGGRNFEIKYISGIWTRRMGSLFLPDGPRFEYKCEDPSSWTDQLSQYAVDTKEFWLLYYQPKEGDVIVDLGAGRGENTFTFSKAVGRTGRVIAIEAHPLSYTILKNFCALNHLTNVTALQVALMDKPGKVRIVESESSWTGNTVQYGKSSSYKVRAATLDDLSEELSLERIDFLKMNIEGAERYALPGAQAVMPRIKQICVACHDFRADLGHGERFRTRAFVGGFLREYGFTLTSRPDDSRDYVRDHIFGLTSDPSPASVKDSVSRNAGDPADSRGLRRTSY